ncbi:MAG TPA: response regulator [Verrucomicrobiae bacterium]
MKALENENASGAKSAGGIVNILIVDDELRNLDVLDSILESPELNLVRAKTAEDALLALVHEEFACIILDIQMPNMSGIELSRLIKTRKRSQHIPVIFLTAYFLEEKDILQGYGAGAVDYLTKPINPQILKSKVGVFVDLFRTTHALAAANGALEQEISQRKKAEEALQQANNELEISGQKAKMQLAAIVESSDDAIVSKDTNGVIVSWNKGAEHLFGYTAEEVVGKSVTVLIPPDHLNEEPEILSRIRRGEFVRHYETVRRCKNGTLIDISLTVSPIKDADGKVIGASKIARDITGRKIIEHKLKQANEEMLVASRAKDDFLATLSHELRTPLNPVLLIASDAANNHDLSPRTRTDFDTIRKNIELEARLIDDLLDLTRITRGKISLHKDFLDARRILEDAIANVRDEMNQKHIALKMDLKAAQHKVFADPVRLQQIFWNLLKNAVKFTPKDGQITIETGASENKLAIKIIDTGIGMTPEETGCIFTAFSQGNHTGEGSAHRFGGLGLGLAISQKLAEFHSGKILAASEGRDKGSTFIIELPLAQTTGINEDGIVTLPPDLSPDLPAKANGVRVLLVEDHEPTRSALTQLLMRRSYKVVAASSIAEARILAAAENFNLVVSDIGLPDGNGYDLMAELRKNGSVTKGIALTGYGMEEDVARSRDAGFVAHLTKPVSIQSLETALNAVADS